MEDTIVAISTAVSGSAISIVRMSGKESINIIKKIFEGKDLEKVSSHTINYGFIKENDKLIDEVMVTIMKAPKTFTKEDIVEINCHGGYATTNKILELLIKLGCRIAEPGEFTKRAYLNGRIDLQEAEGIMDLIEAKTDKAREQALNQVRGKVSNLIKDLRTQMIEIIANIEVNIDYPEYQDIEEMTIASIKPRLSNLRENINKIIAESKNGKIIKDGIDVAIIGKPNVGKSSLLNTLLEEDKAIVTSIAGTTRDIVEGKINLDGIILNIIDTAGIRKTEDIVEKIGVEKSKNLISKADLILYMLNNNEELDSEELELLDLIKDKKHIIILNKNDLENKLNLEKLEKKKIIKMSTIDKTGIEELKSKIKELFNFNEIESKDLTYVTSARGLGILGQVLIDIDSIEKGLEQELPIDIIEIDLKSIWNKLGEITGDSYEGELIDQLFSQFCLGK